MTPKQETWVSVAQARAMLGVSARTLRLYTQNGTLPDNRGPGGRRIFRESDVLALRQPKNTRHASPVIAYARVSSHRQRNEGDLDRQIGRLTSAANERGRLVRVYSDVASGLNDKRPGLYGAITACQHQTGAILLVEHRDRLARFGTRTLEHALAASGVSIEVLDESDETGDERDLEFNDERELVTDMIAIVTSFSGRLYGQRSAKQRRAVCGVKKAIEDDGDDTEGPWVSTTTSTSA